MKIIHYTDNSGMIVSGSVTEASKIRMIAHLMGLRCPEVGAWDDYKYDVSWGGLQTAFICYDAFLAGMEAVAEHGTFEALYVRNARDIVGKVLAELFNKGRFYDSAREAREKVVVVVDEVEGQYSGVRARRVA